MIEGTRTKIEEVIGIATLIAIEKIEEVGFHEAVVVVTTNEGEVAAVVDVEDGEGEEVVAVETIRSIIDINEILSQRNLKITTDKPPVKDREKENESKDNARTPGIAQGTDQGTVRLNVVEIVPIRGKL